jgi:hypothetical protein
LKTGILLYLFVIHLPILCFTQIDTILSIPLDSIEIQKRRLDLFNTGIKVQKISDKSLQDFNHLNLSDLLALETGV